MPNGGAGAGRHITCLARPVGVSGRAPRACVPDRLTGTLLVLAALGVGLGAVLRLGRLDLAQFQSDEATWLRIAEDFVRLGRVPLYGPLSSQGIPGPPLFEYFLAAAAAISRQPVGPTATVALGNVAGLAGTVWLAWR